MLKSLSLSNKKKDDDSSSDDEEDEKNDDEYLNTIKTTKDDVLYVIAIISNPARFEKRYKLFKEFCKRMKTEKYVKLVTVELQQGCRPFATKSMIKLRTDHEIWYKENLINIAVKHLPHDWKYMAWIDTDLEFQNKDWARETIERNA